MNWKKYTTIFIVSVIIAIAIYDVIAIVQGGTEASISHTLIIWSYKFPVFTFAVGFTMGHIFWRVRETKETAELTKKNEGQK